ncbi:MAG: hypothetical protein WA919_12160 [Coleofasciculaceae cyanobacterium]
MDNGSQIEAAIAQLKEVIGSLWKKVDEAQINSSSDNELINRQIAEWTSINLQLMKLLTARTEETERLASNVSKLTSTLEELKQLSRVSPQRMNESSSSNSSQEILKRGVVQTLVKIEEINQRLVSQSQSLEEIKLSYPLERRRISVGSFELDFSECKEIFLGLAIVSYVLMIPMNMLLGSELRWWQMMGDSDYRQALEIVEWNREQLRRARWDGREKSTLWIVPPEGRSE